MADAHDMGGLPAGPVDRAEHDNTFFEKRVDALLRLLSDNDRRIIRVDEMRRGIESLPDYAKLTYYERWVKSAEILLKEKGVLSAEEIAQRIADIQKEKIASGQD